MEFPFEAAFSADLTMIQPTRLFGWVASSLQWRYFIYELFVCQFFGCVGTPGLLIPHVIHCLLTLVRWEYDAVLKSIVLFPCLTSITSDKRWWRRNDFDINAMGLDLIHQIMICHFGYWLWPSTSGWWKHVYTQTIHMKFEMSEMTKNVFLFKKSVIRQITCAALLFENRFKKMTRLTFTVLLLLLSVRKVILFCEIF